MGFSSCRQSCARNGVPLQIYIGEACEPEYMSNTFLFATAPTAPTDQLLYLVHPILLSNSIKFVKNLTDNETPI